MADYLNLAEWKLYYSDIGLPPDISQRYIDYCKPLVSIGVPPIFEFDHLAFLLGKEKSYLASVVNSSDYHYRQFTIPKRAGGLRDIAAPYPALYDCQYWIYHHILKKIRISYCAHGFAAGKSIKTNAAVHLGANVILKMDMRDFFPSISLRRVISIFQEIGYANNVSVYLAKICCMQDALPQGSPASPALSNIVARGLDRRLLKLSRKLDYKYTRYADDMTFSGSKMSLRFADYIKGVVEDEGFEIREDKTRIVKGGRKIVTGISVSGEELALPSSYKRKLRQNVYYIYKFGLYSHTSKRKIRDPYYIDKIFGMLNFWHWIEPGAAFPREMIPVILDVKKNFGTRIPD